MVDATKIKLNHNYVIMYIEARLISKELDSVKLALELIIYSVYIYIVDVSNNQITTVLHYI